MCVNGDDFHIVLQKGIQGGFTPPIPDARYVITRTGKSNTFTILTQLRPHGQPQLLPPTPKELNVVDNATELGRLIKLLRDIPPQYIGAEDLYGRNISILHATDASAFVDLHRSGSAAGAGVPRPTEEQKARFDEAVSIIQKLGA